MDISTTVVVAVTLMAVTSYLIRAHRAEISTLAVVTTCPFYYRSPFLAANRSARDMRAPPDPTDLRSG
jgi:hypothetical protein